MALDTTIGGTSADSYATLAEYEAYATRMGWTLALTDAENETNMRRAALYIDGAYGFVGARQYDRQALAWPRVYTGLVRGFAVPIDAIPAAVKNAQIEMAFYMQGGATALDSYDGAIAGKRVKAGPVESETTYLGGKGRASYTTVDLLLRDYLAFGRGQTPVVRG